MAEPAAGYVPVKGAAFELGLSPSTVLRLLRWGLIPYERRSPRVLLISAAVVARLQREGTELLERFLARRLTADEVRARIGGKDENPACDRG